MTPDCNTQLVSPLLGITAPGWWLGTRQGSADYQIKLSTLHFTSIIQHFITSPCRLFILGLQCFSPSLLLFEPIVSSFLPFSSNFTCLWAFLTEGPREYKDGMMISNIWSNLCWGSLACSLSPVQAGWWWLVTWEKSILARVKHFPDISQTKLINYWAGRPSYNIVHQYLVKAVNGLFSVGQQIGDNQTCKRCLMFR